MRPIKLASPVPRQECQARESFGFKLKDVAYLSTPSEPQPRILWDVLASRASRREFDRLDEGDLNRLLWLCAKTRQSRLDSGRISWESRPVPSAGGLHPIRLFVIDREGDMWRLRLYDPRAHAISSVTPVDELAFTRFCTEVEAVLHPGGGTIVWFVADWNVVDSKYQNADSLVWRDAGAMLSTICLVAEGLELNCCPIGITGDPTITEALGGQDKLLGVGGCIVGSRSS
jgi:SagB-type dehydrogenase family enzyme